MAATQKPIHGSAFQATLDAAACRDRPSWYLVAAQDRSISPELQRLYARRANATTVERGRRGQRDAGRTHGAPVTASPLARAPPVAAA
jgi:hypothetical protein